MEHGVAINWFMLVMVDKLDRFSTRYRLNYFVGVMFGIRVTRVIFLLKT
jgi:hypothetical protein